MFHPKVKLQWINDQIGHGLFATDFIPKGAITYIKDEFEIIISQEKFAGLPPQMQALMDKYSFIEANGDHIVSWDLAKYVNHCCNCNTMSTGYGFEIAIRDIQPNEQITDEYAIFNLDAPMQVNCGNPACRRTIFPEDFDRLYPQWDELLKPALRQMRQVEQPLGFLLDETTAGELDAFFADEKNYKSVYTLRRKGEKRVARSG